MKQGPGAGGQGPVKGFSLTPDSQPLTPVYG